jgi:hypothetical protein
MRPTLQLLLDLVREVRELTRLELSLVRTEISERASGIPSGLAALAVGVVLLPLALGLILVAASLALKRFGVPLDLALLIVALVTIVASLLCLRSGVARLKLSRLVPARSISQISSLLGGSPWA